MCGSDNCIRAHPAPSPRFARAPISARPAAVPLKLSDPLVARVLAQYLSDSPSAGGSLQGQRFYQIKCRGYVGVLMQAQARYSDV